jgi:tRNA1Val (adenine37-N6)-methyltransferase
LVNNFFQFKKFRIDQNDQVFRVGTDGVLLGAWVQSEAPKRILDIGTGTGLIALMCAQRFPKSEIIAIEPNENGFACAVKNFENSIWGNRITAQCSTIQDFSESNSGTFDLIVCNPPFFKNSLLNQDIALQTARHETTLPLPTLLNISARLLSDSAKLSLILPVLRESDLLEAMVVAGLCLDDQLSISAFARREPNRIITTLSKSYRQAPNRSSIYIYESQGVYGAQFSELVKEFYLA